MMTKTKQKLLLNVAVGMYAHPNMQRLEGVLEAAERFHYILNENDLPHFEQMEYKQLLNGEATRDKSLSELNHIVEKAESYHQVIIYLGGHGCQKLLGKCPCFEDDMTRYFLPHEATDSEPHIYGITACELAFKLAKIKSSEIILILDFCYSGGMLEFFRQHFTKLLQNKNNFFIIASALPFQKANDVATNTRFMECFCDALDEAGIVDSNGFISAFQAYQYAKKWVRLKSSYLDHSTHTPDYFGCEEDKPIYLTKPPTPLNGMTRIYLLIPFDPNNPTQAEIVKEKIEKEYPGIKVVYAGDNSLAS